MRTNVSEQIGEPVSEAVRVRRGTARATYDAQDVKDILDAAYVAHVGTVRDGLPMVIPMFFVRDGDHILLHGAPATGSIRRGHAGPDICVTVTLLDGLVMARSSFHHSVNYRSVVLIGEAEVITDDVEKANAIEQIIEVMAPGRQATLRTTNSKEFMGTDVLRLSIEQASAKIRGEGPIDDEEDYELDMWAGVVPIVSTLGEPIPDDRLKAGIEVPDHIRRLVGRTI